MKLVKNILKEQKQIIPARDPKQDFDDRPQSLSDVFFLRVRCRKCDKCVHVSTHQLREQPKDTMTTLVEEEKEMVEEAEEAEIAEE